MLTDPELINELKSLRKATWLISISISILFFVLVCLIIYGGYKFYASITNITNAIKNPFDQAVKELQTIVDASPDDETTPTNVVLENSVAVKIFAVRNSSQATALLAKGAPACQSLNDDLKSPKTFAGKQKILIPLFVGTHGLGKSFSANKQTAAAIYEAHSHIAGLVVLALSVNISTFTDKLALDYAIKLVTALRKANKNLIILWTFDELDTWLLDPYKKVDRINKKNISEFIEQGGFDDKDKPFYINFTMNNSQVFEVDYLDPKNADKTKAISAKFNIPLEYLQTENQLSRLHSFTKIYVFLPLNVEAAKSFAGTNKAMLDYIEKSYQRQFSLRELLKHSV
ncbi:OpmnVgp113-like protein [Cotesia congregata filamentous virus 1]|uniref:OpmnVgp113-like protein n=1 Tax=Cotesia congregata filamentous virus 1 TaxID=3064291 RepID=A0ABC8QK75_9VIRU|nr:OpmnVgp113-like protein [Cotesia congregata filamentous virus 1]